MSTFSLCACGSRPTAHPQSPQQRDGVYRNVVPRTPMGFLKTVACLLYTSPSPRD